MNDHLTQGCRGADRASARLKRGYFSEENGADLYSHIKNNLITATLAVTESFYPGERKQSGCLRRSLSQKSPQKFFDERNMCLLAVFCSRLKGLSKKKMVKRIIIVMITDLYNDG